jgi:hypothetical protein
MRMIGGERWFQDRKTPLCGLKGGVFLFVGGIVDLLKKVQ